MEETNELSDIILEKEDNKSLKMKRILIIAALLILIFLVALVAMKVVNQPTRENQSTKLILPPEPNIEQTAPQSEDNLFKQVPIAEETKQASFDAMVKSLKEKEMKKQEKITKPIIEDSQKVIEAIAEQEILKATIKTTTPEKVIQAPKKVIPATISQPKVDNLATIGVYLQVAATSKLTPDKRYLAKITEKNYEYRLLPIEVKGKRVTKILIGPYPNTAVAKNVLADVKKSINKDAFIYRVK
jgi:DedD protein